LSRTLTELGINIGFARICTEKGAAIDSFYVTDECGDKITDEGRQELIMERLKQEIAGLASASG
jgi:[protein-PII] uridylyltransferase